MKKILFIPDVHHPFADRRAWNLVRDKVVAHLDPDICVIMGDFVDCVSVSSYAKEPEKRNLKREISYARRELEKLTDNLRTDCRNIFIEGNHEHRLKRYLMTKAPELFDLVSMEELMNLEDLGWEFVPYMRHVKIGKLYATHDAGSAGRYAHYRGIETYQHNVVIGHTHRLGYVVEGDATGERHVAASLGWLGAYDGIDYRHEALAKRFWVHGFGVGYMHTNGFVHVQPIPIVNGSCIVEGEVIR